MLLLKPPILVHSCLTRYLVMLTAPTIVQLNVFFVTILQLTKYLLGKKVYCFMYNKFAESVKHDIDLIWL